mmetsp:Transcript_73843/g.175795  ORF Transcript_73843/g.175795 Transcript_73843/m.175795 type:complete len:423 (+) Transcript_73843:188-1456(+)|eukprot:CAMPEP_0178389882 /NCGR_PEP_ID=MMETSP0689_2-20121128/10357_1 /TAXON_ID=160604 /ORGANISM="Amphidinium massartii, Strain CS-259" /LENGTH=422 /DNA_ID=CAMNT_0020010369 /DNA_START=102 /DNA_END=1370 /DNA_ORIENTATION=-
MALQSLAAGVKQVGSTSELADLSNFRAGVNMLKGLIGFGILALPWATAQVGLVPSCFGMAIIAFGTLAGILLSAVSKARLEDGSRMGELESLVPETKGAADAPLDTAAWGSALGFFDKVVGQTLGFWPQVTFIAATCLLQFGTGVAYISAVSENAEAYLHWSRERSALVLATLLAVLSLFERLRRVAYISLVALLVFGVIFAALAVQGTENYHEHRPHTHVAKGADANYGAWFGVTSFAFGGFGIANVILPDMKQKQDFPMVMCICFAICWVIYVTFGTAGYIFYGDATEDLIYMSFPRQSIAFAACVASVSVILSFTFVLQMTPVFQLTRQLLPTVHYAFVHIPVVVFASLVAYLSPNVIFVISTLGAIGGGICGYILPAIVFLKIGSRHEVALHAVAIFVLLLGVAGSTMAVASAVLEVV